MSIGVILYTLLIGSFPFANDDQQTLFRIICSGQMDTSQPEWGQVSDEVKDLLKGLLDVNPATRLTAADALNHTWFTANKDCSSNDLRKSHSRLHGFADAMNAAVRTFEPGEYLVRQGEIGREVFLLRERRVRRVVADERGNERVVATRGKGEFIGEMVKLDEKEAGGKPEDRERGRHIARRRDGVEQGGHAVGGGPRLLAREPDRGGDPRGGKS